MALHDNAIDDALAEFVAARRVVGVMGGHAVERGQPAYADAAQLGHDLAAAGCTVATGGGPGAMEAANLGAALSDPAALTAALPVLAGVPSFHPSVTDWARAGFAAVEGRALSELSLGVPTWFYGHEPPNPFCTRVAKYFRNAIREDILLHVCRAGIVFLPGAAGTLQEIFQAACENYYSPPDELAPMVLVGRDYWTRELPAWPLLSTLAAGRPFARRLTLVDRPEEVLAVLGEELGRLPG
jgi:predicted Rossmann-fold nucleotide-binding protein